MRTWFASNQRGFGRRFAGAGEQERGLARYTAYSGIRLVAFAVGVMVSWGCASQNFGDPQAQIATGRSEMAQGDSQSNQGISPVEISLTIRQYGKPPLKHLMGEVVLRNDRSEPHWFLIPTSLPRDPRSGGVYKVEVSAISGPQPGVIGYLHGTDAYAAVLLSPHAEVKMHGLQIDYWGEALPHALEVQVRIASEVSLGGEPLRQWFGVDPMNTGRVDGEATYGTRLSRRTPGDNEVSLLLSDEQVASVTAPVQSPGGRP